jgi:hypothetical protein
MRDLVDPTTIARNRKTNNRAHVARIAVSNEHSVRFVRFRISTPQLVSTGNAPHMSGLLSLQHITIVAIELGS